MHRSIRRGNNFSLMFAFIKDHDGRKWVFCSNPIFQRPAEFDRRIPGLEHCVFNYRKFCICVEQYDVTNDV